MSTYVFDAAWERERDRLGALESLFDGASRRLLTDVGVGEGWRCLEVGCGAGGIARWLSDRVGPEGYVLATDLDTRFLDGAGLSNLDVRRHDIVADHLEEDGFDLVHARAVLEHLPARDEVLPRLAAALKPGGWLLIEDVDFGESVVGLQTQYFPAPQVRDAVSRIFAAVAVMFAAIGLDASYARRLPAALADAGLVDVAGEIHTPIVAGGAEWWTRGSIEHLAERLIGTGLVSAQDVELYLTSTVSPSTFYPASLMVSVWGRRPTG